MTGRMRANLPAEPPAVLFLLGTLNSSTEAMGTKMIVTLGRVGMVVIIGGGICCRGGNPTPPLGDFVVSSVTVAPPTLSLQTGESQTLTATVLDRNGLPVPGAKVNWSSGGADVAVVNSSGKVTAAKVGSAEIRATAADKMGTSLVTVNLRPWYNENWDYSSISALKQSVAYAFENNGSLSLLKGEQTPYGTINALKATVNGGYSTVGANLYPTQSAVDRPREVWFEVLVKFDSNWRTATVPEQSADHKTIFYTETGEVNRWAIHIGVFGGAVQGRINSGFAKQIRPDLDLPTWIWDGTWHRLRWHLKMGNGDGVFEMWLDEVKYLAETGINTASGSRYFDVIALGRNGGFAEAASMYWGPVNVYISNPGW